MAIEGFYHQPVLFRETIEWLNLKEGATYVDCTLGEGGHARAAAEIVGPAGRVIGIDRDVEALSQAARKLAQTPARIDLVHDNYTNLPQVMRSLKLTSANAFLFDLGISSLQVDREERGFSYMADAPLDMRMDRTQEISAADLVNNLPPGELAGIIAEYGEERWAARIAEFIFKARRLEPIATTGRLVQVIKDAIPAGARRSGPHPARRTFQALRIAVNNEIEPLEGALKQAVAHAAQGGRVVVISFHSLEDRIAKRIFRDLEADCVCPPEIPVCVCQKVPEVKVLTKKPVTATLAERRENPRARSAKLRVAEKV